MRTHYYGGLGKPVTSKQYFHCHKDRVLTEDVDTVKAGGVAPRHSRGLVELACPSCGRAGSCCRRMRTIYFQFHPWPMSRHQSAETKS